MQMGRWFWLPTWICRILCRLYLTPDLEMWFRHVSNASEGAAQPNSITWAMIGATPEQYGLRVQSTRNPVCYEHPTRCATRANSKFRFKARAKSRPIFLQEIRRIVSMRRGFVHSWPSSANFRGSSPSRARPGGKRHIWKNSQLWSKVAGAEVAGLIGGMLFPEEARDIAHAKIKERLDSRRGHARLHEGFDGSTTRVPRKPRRGARPGASGRPPRAAWTLTSISSNCRAAAS